MPAKNILGHFLWYIPPFKMITSSAPTRKSCKSPRGSYGNIFLQNYLQGLPCPSKRGSGRVSYVNKFQVELVSGVLAEFMVRAQGREPPPKKTIGEGANNSRFGRGPKSPRSTTCSFPFWFLGNPAQLQGASQTKWLSNYFVCVRFKGPYRNACFQEGF